MGPPIPNVPQRASMCRSRIQCVCMSCPPPVRQHRPAAQQAQPSPPFPPPGPPQPLSSRFLHPTHMLPCSIATHLMQMACTAACCGCEATLLTPSATLPYLVDVFHKPSGVTALAGLPLLRGFCRDHGHGHGGLGLRARAGGFEEQGGASVVEWWVDVWWVVCGVVGGAP